MYLVKLKSGIYYIYYEGSNGKKNRRSTRTRIKSEALKSLTQFKSDVVSQNKTPLSKFIWEYLKYSEGIHASKTTRSIKSVMNSFLRFTGDIDISKIDSDLLREYFLIKARISNYTAQQHLRYLRKAFNEAVKGTFGNNILEINPFLLISNFKLPIKQPLYFTKKESEFLLSIIDDSLLKDIVIVAFYTGLRLGEIISLKRKQLDFEESLINISNIEHRTKSNRFRVCPMHIKAKTVLVKFKNTNPDYLIFTRNKERINPNYISKKFKKYVIKSGLNPKYKFHSTRHTTASWLIQAGVSLFVVSKILGHTDIRTTQIYSHLEADDLKNALNQLI